MPNLIDFLLGRWLQRMVCTAVLFWICAQMNQSYDSYLPWVLVVLTWMMEHLAWQDGVVAGARGWDRMPESKRAEVRKLYNLLDKKDSND